MKSLELTIATDFLNKFSKTQALSIYSPKASLLIKICKRAYPSENGGVYDIRLSHLLEAARSNSILIRHLENEDFQLGISAEEVNSGLWSRVLSEADICKHGYAPYTYVLGENRTPVRRLCCPSCVGGGEVPTEDEIERAAKWLVKTSNEEPPFRGALILAGRRLGFEESKPHSKIIQISRKRSR